MTTEARLSSVCGAIILSLQYNISSRPLMLENYLKEIEGLQDHYIESIVVFNK